MSSPPLFVWAPGVEIIAVQDLPPKLQDELQGHRHDFAVSARYTRQTTSLVDPPTVELLDEFREPSSIERAVQRYASRTGDRPSDVLEQAWSTLEVLLRRGLLLSTKDPRMTAAPALVAGDSINDWTVIRPIRELEDTQIYLAKNPKNQLGVVKMRARASTPDREAIDNEARILESLEGSLAPRLLAVDNFGERPFLVSQWCPGIGVEQVASRWRLGHGRGGDRRSLLRLAKAVAAAFGRLHEFGILHGDVHPQNVLVDAENRVWLVDFTLSSRIADGPVGQGGGISFYRAPEIARDLLAGKKTQADTLSEQFSIAALVYRLLTGHHYRDFDLEKETQLRQTAEAGMLPFRHRNLPDWPKIETILAKALDERPERRFETVRSFAKAFAAVSSRQLEESPPGTAGALAKARSRILSSWGPQGAWWQEPLRSPMASVQNGAGGIALAASRIALLEEDSEILSIADLWIRRARRDLAAPEAFTSSELSVTSANIGHGSPQHNESGVHAVDSLIAHLGGQRQRQEASLRRYLESVNRPFLGLDVTLGTASQLVTGAILLETLHPGEIRDSLKDGGDRALTEIWSGLSEEPIIHASSIDNLGLAHGWAGFLFATLRWREVSSGTWPPGFEDRLAQWAETAEPLGRGLRWPWNLGHLRRQGSSMASMPGWCNGTAGHLLLACKIAGSGWTEFFSLAEKAAYDVWDAGSTSASLCCGLVGRAYGLLAMYRLTGDAVWHHRATVLAETAASSGSFAEAPPYSLFKGALSLAVLASDLDHAESAAFPFIEGDGWIL
ncbi:MAG: protein kinase [Deltaproteobacteria bacterium]|nr:protein kinase [Deltaproteobacteria bacterium]